MERRLTAFLLPLIAVAVAFLLWPRQGATPNAGTTPTQNLQEGVDSRATRPATGKVLPLEEYRFTKSFGRPGEPGAMWVSFDKRGAAVTKVWLRDHFESVESKRKQDHDPASDFYVLVKEAQPGFWGMMLEPEGSARQVFDPAPIDGLVNKEGEYQTWSVQQDEESVTFSLDCKNGYVFEKSFRHVRGRRDLEVAITLKNVSHATEEVQLALRGFSLTAPTSDQMIGSSPSAAFGLRLEAGKPADSGKIVHVGGTNTREEMVSNSSASSIAFAGSMNRFFAAFLVPLDKETQQSLYAVHVDKIVSADSAGGAVPVPRYSLKLRPEKGQSATLKCLLYLGPKSYDIWKERPEYEHFRYALDADLAPVGCFCTVPGSATMAMVLLKGLSLLHSWFGSWPLAIILLTLLVRICIVPLNFRMQKTMRAFGAKMGKLKPQMDALQKQHADDPKALQAAMVKFQRENKMFPPLGGCLPLLITMPVFFGMFTAVRACYGLRHEPLFLWIQDLSRPDMLFHLGWGFVDWFNLLPFVMVGMWWLMQSSTPAPTDPQQKQMYQMMKFMPFMMGVMLYGYAAGLMLYMITSSTFQIVESKIVRKILGPVDPNAAVLAPAPQF